MGEAWVGWGDGGGEMGVGSRHGPFEPAGPEDGAVQRQGSWAKSFPMCSSLWLGRSPETPASVGGGPAEYLQREASGHGGARPGPGQGPRSSQSGGSRGWTLTREALVGQVGRAAGWQVVCGDGRPREVPASGW